MFSFEKPRGMIEVVLPRTPLNQPTEAFYV